MNVETLQKDFVVCTSRYNGEETIIGCMAPKYSHLLPTTPNNGETYTYYFNGAKLEFKWTGKTERENNNLWRAFQRELKEWSQRAYFGVPA